MTRRTLAALAAWCCLAGPFIAILQAEDAPSVLALTAGPVKKRGIYKSGLFYRELLRQAPLIAARDELGLSTRDMALRETMPETSDARIKKLEISTDVDPSRSADFLLTDGETTILSHRIPLQDKQPLSARQIAQAMEELSRGPLVEALREAGFQGTRNPQKSDVAVPAEVESLLSELNFFSQFAAVRELHDLQKTQGESPETLAALARGYANLGQLTFFHWNATHKVCRARALLYANRLMHADPDSAWALWNRGYVSALIGLPGDALADFDAAQKLNRAAKTRRKAPTWLATVEAYCRFNYNTIAEGTDKPEVRELAALLSYLAVENIHCESLSLTTGVESLTINPENYAIVDSMGVRHRGVSNLHRTTAGGPVILLQNLPRRLTQLRNLPTPVKLALQQMIEGRDRTENGSDPAWLDPAGRKEIVSALITAGDTDTAEPSWEFLGRMLEDITLVHAVRRIAFYTDQLGLPPDTYQDGVAQALEQSSEHPYVGLIKFAAMRVPKDQSQALRTLLDVPLVDVDLALRSLLNRSGPKDPALKLLQDKAEQLRDLPKENADPIACDLEYRIFFGNNADLATISPNSPLPTAQQIEDASDKVMTPKKMQQLEFLNARHAVVLRALAARYAKEKNYESASRCYEQYLKMSPDQDGFKKLANVYWYRGDKAKWQSTLEDSLKHPDFGLSHARTRVTIADYLMSQGKFKEAKPFAIAAAETGAAWAMLCAVRCHTGLKEWKQANEFHEYMATRYDMGLEWFRWCKLHGQGNLEDAESHMLERAEQLYQRAQVADLDTAGMFYLCSKRDALARTTFRRFFERHKSNWAGLLAALLADEAKAPGERDKLLAEVVAQREKARDTKDYPIAERIYITTEWIQKDFARGPDEKIDAAAVESILEPDPQAATYALQAYLLGRYLKHRGETDLAIKCADHGLLTPRNDRLTYWLCRDLKESLAPESPTPSSAPKPAEAAQSDTKSPPPAAEAAKSQ